MIPYEDLCQALDNHNRRLRGEEIPADEYVEAAASEDYDIVESAAEGEVVAADDMDVEYVEATPDVTAETAVPDADYGGGEVASDQYAQAEYDSGAVPGAPADQMPSDQYSSGQQAAAQYPEGYDPQQQQYQEGYDQQQQQQYPEGTVPDDQDPNRQQ